jgi:Cu(I)/Ag(I) efflux system membrane protein CusA/SilA
MIGGMVTAPLLSMLVVPAAWYLLHRRRAASALDRSKLEQIPVT